MGNFIKDYSCLMGCLLFYECTEEDQGSSESICPDFAVALGLPGSGSGRRGEMHGK